MIDGRGVYAILDVDAWRARGVELAAEGVAESIVDALLEGGASTVQLRAKNETARATLSLLHRLVPRVQRANVPFVVNDRLDLALLCDADALHVGQDDLPQHDVGRVAPGLALGLSTHDRAQLIAALDARPTYVAFGPVFGTSSKRAPDPTVGLERWREASDLAEKQGIPLVAIGGVTLDRARALVDHGARWAAVIGELVVVEPTHRPDLAQITRRTRALSEVLRGARA